MATACLSAEFFDDLAALKSEFALNVWTKIAPQVASMLPKVFMSWLLIVCFLAMFHPENFFDKVREVFQRGFACTILVAILSPAQGGQPVIFAWVINPMETMALKYAALVVQGLSSSPPVTGNGYSLLSCQVEGQMMRFLEMIYAIVANNYTLDGALSASAFILFIAAVILMLPYLFVLGLFIAFMLEAMFKFLAVGLIGPVLLFFTPFKPLRGFPIAGGRVLFGACLTLMLAAGAMGFTMKTVDKYADQLSRSIDVSLNAGNRAQQEAEAAHKKWLEKCVFEVIPTDECKALADDWQAKREKDTGRDSFAIFTRPYFMMFIIGFASILLHIQAKGLASNISGASDGAGPAAAVVAGGKALLGAGMMAAHRASRTGSGLLFGQAGAGAIAAQMAQAVLPSDAGSVRQNGVIGSLLSGGQGMVGGDAASPSSGGRRAPMGGMGGQVSLDPKTIAALGDAIAQAQAKGKP